MLQCVLPVIRLFVVFALQNSYIICNCHPLQLHNAHMQLQKLFPPHLTFMFSFLGILFLFFDTIRYSRRKHATTTQLPSVLGILFIIYICSQYVRIPFKHSTFVTSIPSKAFWGSES